MLEIAKQMEGRAPGVIEKSLHSTGEIVEDIKNNLKALEEYLNIALTNPPPSIDKDKKEGVEQSTCKLDDNIRKINRELVSCNEKICELISRLCL